MNAGRIIILLLAVALVAGCGSKATDVSQASNDQKKALDEMSAEIRALKNEIRLIRDDLAALNDDVFAIQGNPALTFFKAEEREADDVDVTPGDATAVASETGEAAPVDLEGADFETLVAELTRMRDQVDALRTQYAADKHLEEMRDPRATWEALGNAEELTARLDTFAQSYAQGIEDPTAHDAFLADIAALKDKLAARADLTPEQQLAELKARVTEQLNAETDERRRGWFERQLEMINSGDEEQMARYVEQASRFENARDIGELAQKYEISNDTLRDNGLQAFGGTMGGRRPGQNTGGAAGGGNRGGGGRTRGGGTGGGGGPTGGGTRGGGN
jgi:hypothetical protein